jgi:hypothetical protein
MNNKFYQYYTFDINVGTRAFGTGAPIAGTIYTYTYYGCTHTHLYNWMAVPAIGTPSLTAGLGNSVTAYGYALSGTAVTACTNSMTASVVSSKVFLAAQY